MSKLSHGPTKSRFPSSRSAFSLWRRRLVFLALGLALVAAAARAEDADDTYLEIYTKVQQADALKASGKVPQALAKYKEAEVALRHFRQNNPTWNARVVSQRLAALSDTIIQLTENPEGATGTGGATPQSGSQVKLLQPGTEPRQALHLHPKAGDKQALSLILKIGMSTKVGATEAPSMKIPSITMSLEGTVKEVSPQGDIAYELKMGEPTLAEDSSVMPQIAAALKSALSVMKNSSSTGTMSAHGVNKAVDFKVGAGGTPQDRQMLDQLKDSLSILEVPLPDEPVGPGAKWEMNRRVNAQGIKLDQTQTFELVSIEGEQLTLKSTLSQRAGSQKISSPNMPSAKVDLNSLKANGTVNITVDQTRFLPVAGNSAVHTETVMAMGAAAQKQAVTITLDMDLSLESK